MSKSVLKKWKGKALRNVYVIESKNRLKQGAKSALRMILKIKTLNFLLYRENEFSNVLPSLPLFTS